MLRELQDQFKNAVLADDDQVLKRISTFKGVSPEARVKIYQNNTLVSLKECLLSTYENVAKMVSLEFFRYMADVYIRECPPQHGCLMYYGKNFPDFLSKFEPVKGYPYLPDLALLEWNIQQSANAGIEPSIHIEDLQGLDADTRFCLQSSALVMNSRYALYDLWEELQKLEPNMNEIDINKPQSLILYRSGFDVQLRRLNNAECAFLCENSLESAVQAALKCDHSFDLQNWLKFCLDNAILAK